MDTATQALEHDKESLTIASILTLPISVCSLVRVIYSARKNQNWK